MLLTRCPSLQPRPMCSHHAGVSDQPGVSNSHIEGAPGNVASVELDIDGVDSVLPWNKTDCTLVWKTQITIIKVVICSRYFQFKTTF